MGENVLPLLMEVNGLFFTVGNQCSTERRLASMKSKYTTLNFCFSFWAWVACCSSIVPLCGHSNPASDKELESVVTNSDFVPRAAFFAVYVPRDTCLYGDTQLRLCCIPTSKRCELNDCEEKLGNIRLGDGSSDKPMCSNEKAYVFLSEGIVTPIKPERLQRLYVR